MQHDTNRRSDGFICEDAQRIEGHDFIVAEFTNHEQEKFPDDQSEVDERLEGIFDSPGFFNVARR